MSKDRQGELERIIQNKLGLLNPDKATDLAQAILKEYIYKDDVEGYCKCPEKPVRLISHCRNCGKEIEHPPTIEEMLEEDIIKNPCDDCESAWCWLRDTCEKAKKWLMRKCEPKINRG